MELEILSNSEDDGSFPSAFICPLTLQIMEDPVMVYNKSEF